MNGDDSTVTSVPTTVTREYCVWLQPKIFHHRARDTIPSFSPAWKLEEEVRLRAMEREGAPDTTVVCDPVRRG